MISKTRFLLLFITLQHRILRCIHCGQNIYGGAQTFTSPTLHKNTLLALQIKAIALSLSEMHSFVQQPIFSQVLYVLLFGSSVSLRTSHNITAFAPKKSSAAQPSYHSAVQPSSTSPVQLYVFRQAALPQSDSLELAAEDWSPFPAIP